jgi:hypothetical protein
MKIEGLSCIYKITNPKGKIYIGQTTSLWIRLSKYKNLNCTTQKLLYRSIKKYGWKNHQISILTFCELSICNEKEKYYIEEYKSYYKKYPKIGLNLTIGGKGKTDNFGKGHFKTVLQYDLNGNFIKEWESATYAAKQLNIKMTGIRNNVRGDKLYKQSGGFLWKDKVNNEIPLKIEPVETKYRKFETKTFNIKCINLVTSEIIYYDDIKICGEKIGMHYSQIYRLLKKDGISKSKKLKFEIIRLLNKQNITQNTNSPT